MGKIPQYNRGKFQSSYVGGPQLDTSGVQTAEAVGKVTDTAVNIEAKRIQEKNQLAIEQQAGSALTKYNIAFQTQAQELKKTYADNPGAYPEAVANMGIALQETFSKNLADDRVKARFGGAANTLVRQVSGSAIGWVQDKDAENEFYAWQDNLDTTANAAATLKTPEQLTANLSQIAAISDSYVEGTPAVRIGAREAKTAAAVKSYMGAQMADDARQVWQDIDTGKYTNLTYEHNGEKINVPLSPTLLKEYKDLAQRMSLTQQADKQIQAGLRAAGELGELALQVSSGEKDIQDLVYERDKIYAQGQADGGEPATQEEKDNIDSLIKLESSVLAKSGKADPYVLDDLNSEWLVLADKVSENADSPEKLTSDLLRFSTKANNAFAAGKISQTDWINAHRKLSLPLMQSIQKQAGQRTGIFSGRRYSDPLGGQYKKLNSAVANMTIRDDQKVKTRVRAFSFFMDAVNDAEEGGRTLSTEDYDSLSTKALRKAQAIYFEGVGEPAEKVVTVNGVTLRYVGLNSNGVADYQPDGETQTAAKLKR